jgi:hypothetical protein
VVDLALAALDPTPEAASTPPAAAADWIDAAIEAVVQEDFPVPLEIAQDLPGRAADDALPGSIRRLTTHLA